MVTNPSYPNNYGYGCLERQSNDALGVFSRGSAFTPQGGAHRFVDRKTNFTGKQKKQPVARESWLGMRFTANTGNYSWE